MHKHLKRRGVGLKTYGRTRTVCTLRLQKRVIESCEKEDTTARAMYEANRTEESRLM